MRLKDIRKLEGYSENKDLHFSNIEFLQELLRILNSNYGGDFTVKNNTMLFDCINGQKFLLTVDEVIDSTSVKNNK